MSLVMHMRIDGVVGESSSFKHKGWVDVMSWNWGMTSNRKYSLPKDDVKTSLNEISVIKPIGIDSTEIRNLFAQGKVIPHVDFNIEPVAGKREAQKNYVNIKMEDVVIKSIVTGGGTEDKFFKEHVTFLFDRITFECNRPLQKSDDTEAAAKWNDFRWDVIANDKWAK
jgi:type VI secretion system secreted protein Hcp